MIEEPTMLVEPDMETTTLKTPEENSNTPVDDPIFENVICVFGGKGGVGVSLLSISLAYLISKYLHKSVCLITSEKIVNGAVISIMLDFNIPVMFSKDAEETANILVKMAEREQLKNKRTMAIRTGKKPMSLKERQRFIVESFPDVGALTAENLLMKFGTIESIVNASEDELMEVEGVGKITAKKIKAVLTEKYEK